MLNNHDDDGDSIQLTRHTVENLPPNIEFVFKQHNYWLWYYRKISSSVVEHYDWLAWQSCDIKTGNKTEVWSTRGGSGRREEGDQSQGGPSWLLHDTIYIGQSGLSSSGKDDISKETLKSVPDLHSSQAGRGHAAGRGGGGGDSSQHQWYCVYRYTVYRYTLYRENLVYVYILHIYSTSRY